MQTRENARHQWLKTIYPANDYSLVPLAGDASFRCYFRLFWHDHTRIVMDIPPDKLQLQPFIQIQTLLNNKGIITPYIHALENDLGFALLEDFGDMLFSVALEKENSELLYASAIHTLLQIQDHASSLSTNLQVFDQTCMLQELSLFSDWFLNKYLGFVLSAEENHLIQDTFQILSTHISQQPQVLMHRDYHSRNIMVLDLEQSFPLKLGIIDFQDALLGPFTYDLVSLLKDCYIQLSVEQLQQWMEFYYKQSIIARQYTYAEFQRAVDWCGLQRHLRILGTFCRLHLRDAKSSYLKDLPRTYQYAITCIDKYPEFHAFGQWIKQRIDPVFRSTVL